MLAICSHSTFLVPHLQTVKFNTTSSHLQLSAAPDASFPCLKLRNLSTIQTPWLHTCYTYLVASKRLTPSLHCSAQNRAEENYSTTHGIAVLRKQVGQSLRKCMAGSKAATAPMCIALQRRCTLPASNQCKTNRQARWHALHFQPQKQEHSEENVGAIPSNESTSICHGDTINDGEQLLHSTLAAEQLLWRDVLRAHGAYLSFVKCCHARSTVKCNLPCSPTFFNSADSPRSPLLPSHEPWGYSEQMLGWSCHRLALTVTISFGRCASHCNPRCLDDVPNSTGTGEIRITKIKQNSLPYSHADAE